MKKLISMFLVVGFYFSAAKAEEKSTLGLEISSCTVGEGKKAKSYDDLLKCLKKRFFRSIVDPSDNSIIYFWAKSRSNQSVRVELNWKPVAGGRKAFLYEWFLLGTEYPRQVWSELTNNQKEAKLKELSLKNSFIGNATLSIESGFTFKDLFISDDDFVVAELFHGVQKIEASIHIRGMLNNHLQYKGDLLISGNAPSQEPKKIQFEVKSDINPIRQSRPYYLTIIGEDAKELSEALP